MHALPATQQCLFALSYLCSIIQGRISRTLLRTGAVLSPVKYLQRVAILCLCKPEYRIMRKNQPAVCDI